MQVTIKGLTDSVITFTHVTVLNGANLILHGQVEAIVTLDTIEKKTEISGLKNANLISSVIIGEEKEPEPELAPEPKGDEESEDKPKRGRGRPKGSKNKKKDEKEPVLEKVTEDNPEENATPVDPAEEAQDSSRVVVMTAGGEAVSADMQNKMTGEIEESEQTRASIEAMEKIEAEERGEDLETPIDESNEDPNNQMGGKAVVGGAEGASKVAMKNSILPEETNVKADPFIDRGENAEKDEKDDKDNPFIDTEENTVKEEKDQENDPFIDKPAEDDFDAFIDAGGQKDTDFLE
jgi:hypothetical protein